MCSSDLAQGQSSTATVVLSNASVIYWPAPLAIDPDVFTYLVSDGAGGMATGVVSVAVQPEPDAFETMTIEWSGADDLFIRLQGNPDWAYSIQCATNLTQADWQTVGTVLVDGLGRAELIQPRSAAPEGRFYRSVRGIAP